MTDTRKELIEEQKIYCEKNKVPFFMPDDGICWHCKKDMVDESWKTKLKTGCPYCYKSYCD